MGVPVEYACRDRGSLWGAGFYISLLTLLSAWCITDVSTAMAYAIFTCERWFMALYQWHKSITQSHMALTLIGYVGQRVHVKNTTEVTGQMYPVSVFQDRPGVSHVCRCDPLLQYVSSEIAHAVCRFLLLPSPKTQIDTVCLSSWMKCAFPVQDGKLNELGNDKKNPLHNHIWWGNEVPTLSCCNRKSLTVGIYCVYDVYDDTYS